ncbi:DUF6455 family protein [Consotaella aegiceratis]|uniref:DUF6455 family protein n=1 Tax=Consotaella aegiceratis TaxID=3097961 RepID=UPI002F3ECCD6
MAEPMIMSTTGLILIKPRPTRNDYRSPIRNARQEQAVVLSDLFRRLRRRPHLLSRMMRTVGADSTASLMRGPMLRHAAENCRVCARKRECRAWLRWRAKAACAPGFCPNANLLMVAASAANVDGPESTTAASMAAIAPPSH